MITESENQEDKSTDLHERYDQMECSNASFTYVPFNSPQDGFHDILPVQEPERRNSMLDEVSKTLINLYSCGINTDTNTEHVSFEEDQCLGKLSQCLSQCEISDIDSNGELNLECSQQFTSISQQIKFACQLQLMPASLQDMSKDTKNNICSTPSSQTDMPTSDRNLSQENIAEAINSKQDNLMVRTGFDKVSKKILSLSQSAPEKMKFINECVTEEQDDLKDCMTDSVTQSDFVHTNNPVTSDANISKKSQDYVLMASSSLKEMCCLTNDNDSDFYRKYDRELNADVKTTMENLLEKCSNVFVEDDENANTGINQYAAEHSGCIVNRLDMRAEKESGLYSECTSLAEYLKGGSGHTNSSTINEANTSDLTKIGEPSADCQVSLPMPCHDNNKQEIGKSHENVAALTLLSSKNYVFELEPSQNMDSGIHVTQVSKNLEHQEISCICKPCSQNYISSGRILDKEDNFHAGLKLNEPLILKNVLSKNDLTSCSDASLDQSELQFSEISFQETVALSTSTSVANFHSDVTVREEKTMKDDESCTTVTSAVLKGEDISNDENNLNHCIPRSEDLESGLEIAKSNEEDVLPFDQWSKFVEIHTENVHATEEKKCEKEMLLGPTNDDISHSSPCQALNPQTWEGALTIHNVINENVMDFHDTEKHDLEIENVSMSKKNPIEEGTTSSTEGFENDAENIMLNIPLAQREVMSGDRSSASGMHNTCSLNHLSKRMASGIHLTAIEENICHNQLEDYQLMSTQQFTASLSQVNIEDYLDDYSNNCGTHPNLLHTADKISVVPDIEDDHTVPSNVFSSSECQDVTMYDNDTNFPSKVKNAEKTETLVAQASCFKWKYAPSLKLDELPVPDVRNCDEDALMTVLPLKTCTRPIRVGLSKRYRAKPLHKTQRL